MPVEGIGLTGGGQAEETGQRSHTERVDNARNEDIEERAQARRESSIGEVDETA